MTTLITGGTGKTGRALADLLRASDYPLIIASRAGKAPEPFKAVKFDWFDQSTFSNPFDADPNIDRVYIVGPPKFDSLSHVQPFIDFAVLKGVKRFVLLSASPLSAGDATTGKVHQYLIDIGVDYTVLRPTWFQENFSFVFYASIRDNNEIFSSTGDGRLPFVSVEDIAQAALLGLTAKGETKRDVLVGGPALLTYAEAAQILTSVLGREIKHKRNTPEEQKQLYIRFGLEEKHADLLVEMERGVEQGGEERLFTSAAEDKKFIGNRTLLEYFQANRELWIKA